MGVHNLLDIQILSNQQEKQENRMKVLGNEICKKQGWITTKMAGGAK